MWPFGKSQPAQGQNNAFWKSADSFAAVFAAIAAIFIVPPVWTYIEDDVSRRLYQLYDDGLVPFLYFGVMIAAYPLAFFAIRMSLVTTAISLVVGLALRFL